ncbi:glycosyltransferase family 4 protein [Dechloromonas sp. ARDL1]|uniref:glycosyltransferase family 4 protein n=1 Tax=Dechloromonas sp. ARDL1 TaxID=3322121 RepID=UPI003DA6FFF4
MKILLSAFACAPNTGSEPGVGWRWAIELAKQHEVVVVTDATRRHLIEPFLAEHPVTSLRVLYFRPSCLRSTPLNSWTAQLLYTAWQFGLWEFAKRLHRVEKFDVAMHVTYGVFRHPSFLGYLGIPFVFGPLGGGEDAPWRLKRSIRGREKIKELLRAALNKVSLVDPFLWIAFAGASSILVKTQDTQNALPWPFRRRALVYPEIGIDTSPTVVPCTRSADQPLRVLFAGRLLGWKGAHLAIRAVALARARGIPVDFTLVGRGPCEQELHRLSESLGEHGNVNWISQIPQQELFALYGTMHCFLFPSLHDSSGNVVLEAQANGLPVICLEVGGPATLVTDESAIVISINGDETSVIEGLAGALQKFFENEGQRLEMAKAAILHAASFAWNDRALGALKTLSAHSAEVNGQRSLEKT